MVAGFSLNRFGALGSIEIGNDFAKTESAICEASDGEGEGEAKGKCDCKGRVNRET